jgi:hypothetical protein
VDEELKPLDATLDLLYEHTRSGPARQSSTADAIDAKAVQVFAAASVVLGLGTFTTSNLNGLTAVLYGLAAVAYIFAGGATWRILQARAFRVTDGADRWWPSHRLVEATFLREQLLDDLASAFDANRKLLEAKGKPLNPLLVATGIEAVLVAAAVIGSLA